MIDGPRSVIQNIYTIDLPVINIEGLTGNQEYVYQVSEILPIGLTSSTNEVVVNVTVNDNVLNRPKTSRTDVGPHIDEEEDESEEATAESTETSEYN